MTATWEIREGDALARLREMPAESVHCCVTSPPYYGLRDYGVEGQLGLEPTPDDYVAALVDVFREVRRVLRPDGTLWLNLGDSYAGSGKGPSNNSTLDRPYRGMSNVAAAPNRWISVPAGVKGKDLLGVPWLAAFALRGDGWWLRQEIIWHKLSPMPESIKDRCTRSHEHVFMLAKSARYYYDAAAIAEDAVSDQPSGNGYARPERESFKNPDGSSRGQGEGWTEIGGKRNKRDVWTLSSQPYPEAHFATFPPKLVEPMILAGCPEGGVVLDPFSGAGTTGVVALRRERSYLGIELNPEYAELSRNRIRDDAPLLNTQLEAAA